MDIIANPSSSGLILAGGYGIRLKLAQVQATGTRTLIPWERMPPARATQDLDFFLALDLFAQPAKGSAVRKLLDSLGYTAVEPRHLQFCKPLHTGSDLVVKVDLLARTGPNSLRVDRRRVGAKPGTGLHGRHTPDAFAVEESPVALPLQGYLTNGDPVSAEVLVPHAYAWVNMKLKAAHDWLSERQGRLDPKPNRAKHLADLYRLIGALTEQELTEAQSLAATYRLHEEAAKLRACAEELFADESGIATREIRQLSVNLDHRQFWEALRLVLG